MQTDTLALFVDASFNTKLKFGIGGYLLFKLAANNPIDELTQIEIENYSIKTIRIIDTTNTKLEIQTLIWALESVETTFKLSIPNITVFTDCQTSVNLLKRREKLQQNQYRSKRTKRILSNADVYRHFFKTLDRLNVDLKWVKGHMAKNKQSNTNRLFARVDKFVRHELRQHAENTVINHNSDYKK